jgi:hypothetical protein
MSCLTESEMELGNILTQANLDILNELNRLKQLVAPQNEVPRAVAATTLTGDVFDGYCADRDNEDFHASSFDWLVCQTS